MNSVECYRTRAKLIGKSHSQTIPADGNADDLPECVVAQTRCGRIIPWLNELWCGTPGPNPFLCRTGISCRLSVTWIGDGASQKYDSEPGYGTKPRAKRTKQSTARNRIHC